MNMEAYAESRYVNAELIDKSETKVVTITGDCKVETGKFGESLVFPCELDSKPKLFQPNGDMLKNLRGAVQSWDSKALLGKQFKLGTTVVAGKKRVIFDKMVK